MVEPRVAALLTSAHGEPIEAERLGPVRRAIETCWRAAADRRHSFSAWLRMLLEDMLVIDAATLYPRFDRAGRLYSRDVIDGATITPLIGEDGRSPEPPDPAYQQILHGVPDADFSANELVYLPRNLRAHKLYGFSPVEQITLTVNIALRREAATLDYYRAGSTQEGSRRRRRGSRARSRQMIHTYPSEADLEFVWVGDDAVDPLQQAQTLNILDDDRR